MTQRTLLASASRFAHLIPGHRAAKAEDTDPKDAKSGRKAEDDKPKKKDDEDDKDARRAEEPDAEPDDGEGVDGDPEPDLDDVVDPDDSLDEDAAPEESDSDPKVRKAAKAGRKAERARWASVMGHKASAGRVAAACQLLSTTTASAKSVVGTLAALPAAAAPVASGRTRLDDRMAERPNAKIGQDAPAAAGGDFGAQTRAAMNKVRPAR